MSTTSFLSDDQDLLIQGPVIVHVDYNQGSNICLSIEGGFCTDLFYLSTCRFSLKKITKDIQGKVGWRILKYCFSKFFFRQTREIQRSQRALSLPDNIVHHCLLNITKLHCQALAFLFVRNIILYCTPLPFPVSQSQACKSITIQIVWKLISE